MYRANQEIQMQTAEDPEYFISTIQYETALFAVSPTTVFEAAKKLG